MARMINRLFRLTLFPLTFQLLTLVVFIMLIFGGLLANTDDMAFAKVLLLWSPSRVEEALGASGALGRGMVKSLTLFVALPAILWLLPFAAFLNNEVWRWIHSQINLVFDTHRRSMLQIIALIRFEPACQVFAFEGG
jgi:hypothetical protein